MDPTKNGNGTPDQERAESKILKTGKAYQSGESWANGNPGPFNDPQIEAYLAFLTRELIFSDDPRELQAFLSAHYGYNKFQKCGTPACRCYAWHSIQLACRLSAKSRHDIKAPSSKSILGHPGAPISPEGQPK